MVIALIIISILFVLSLIIILAMSRLIKDQIQLIVKPDLYPCKTLYVITRFNQLEERTLTDFSRYEKEKIIIQTIDIPRPPQSVEEETIDGMLVALKPAVVYKVKDEYLWSY